MTEITLRLLVEDCDVAEIEQQLMDWYCGNDIGMDDWKLSKAPGEQASGQAQPAGVQTLPSDPEAAEAAREQVSGTACSPGE